MLAELQGYDLSGMFDNAVSGDLVDLEMVKYVLNRLPSIVEIDETVRREILLSLIHISEPTRPY